MDTEETFDRKFALRVLCAALIAGLVGLAIAVVDDRGNESDVAKLKEDLNALDKSTASFQAATRKKLSEVSEAIDRVENGVKELKPKASGGSGGGSAGTTGSGSGTGEGAGAGTSSVGNGTADTISLAVCSRSKDTSRKLRVTLTEPATAKLEVTVAVDGEPRNMKAATIESGETSAELTLPTEPAAGARIMITLPSGSSSQPVVVARDLPLDDCV